VLAAVLEQEADYGYLARSPALGQQRAARMKVKRLRRGLAADRTQKSPAGAGLFVEAAEGIRTLDLLPVIESRSKSTLTTLGPW